MKRLLLFFSLLFMTTLASAQAPEQSVTIKVTPEETKSAMQIIENNPFSEWSTQQSAVVTNFMDVNPIVTGPDQMAAFVKLPNAGRSAIDFVPITATGFFLENVAEELKKYGSNVTLDAQAVSPQVMASLLNEMVQKDIHVEALRVQRGGVTPALGSAVIRYLNSPAGSKTIYGGRSSVWSNAQFVELMAAFKLSKPKAIYIKIANDQQAQLFNQFFAGVSNKASLKGVDVHFTGNVDKQYQNNYLKVADQDGPDHLEIMAYGTDSIIDPSCAQHFAEALLSNKNKIKAIGLSAPGFETEATATEVVKALSQIRNLSAIRTTANTAVSLFHEGFTFKQAQISVLKIVGLITFSEAQVLGRISVGYFDLQDSSMSSDTYQLMNSLLQSTQARRFLPVILMPKA